MANPAALYRRGLHHRLGGLDCLWTLGVGRPEGPQMLRQAVSCPGTCCLGLVSSSRALRLSPVSAWGPEASSGTTELTTWVIHGASRAPQHGIQGPFTSPGLTSITPTPSRPVSASQPCHLCTYSLSLEYSSSCVLTW